MLKVTLPRLYAGAIQAPEAGVTVDAMSYGVYKVMSKSFQEKAICIAELQTVIKKNITILIHGVSIVWHHEVRRQSAHVLEICTGFKD